ncbi:MAG TPA: NAD(P)/FAD-dependent oxidoreductase [Pseudonocardia sp.]|jgi:protoporphyrinogen oxidase
MSTPRNAVVVGAGLAGLAAAFRLTEQGWTVTVLESSDRSGGRVRGLARNGFVLDTGPTLITDHYTEYLRLVDDLGLRHLVVDSSPLIGVVRDGQLHVLDASRPVRSFLSTKLLSARAKLRLLVRGLRLVRPLWKLNPYELTSHLHYDTESMEQYLNRTFGQELNESLLAAVARGVTLSTPKEASVIEFFAGAVAATGTMQNLIGGLEVLPAALAARLDVRRGCPVDSVHKTSDGVLVSYRDPAGAAHQLPADACVITTRFTDAVELYPPLKEPGADLLYATSYTGCYSLQLMYDRRPGQEPFIVMVPKSDSAEIAAIFLEHVKAPDRAPAGHSHITVFFNPSDTPEIADRTDQQLTEVATRFVESLFPELAGHQRESELTRWDYAAHKGNVGYYRALGTFLRNHPADDPVQVAGDYLAVSGQESAVIAGVNAAKRLLSS